MLRASYLLVSLTSTESHLRAPARNIYTRLHTFSTHEHLFHPISCMLPNWISINFHLFTWNFAPIHMFTPRHIHLETFTRVYSQVCPPYSAASTESQGLQSSPPLTLILTLPAAGTDSWRRTKHLSPRGPQHQPPNPVLQPDPLDRS